MMFYKALKVAEETVRGNFLSKQLLVVTEIFGMSVNDFDAERSARCNRTPCKWDPVPKKKNWKEPGTR